MNLEAELGLDLERRLCVLKALSDRSRIAMVNALLERPHCPEELAERLKLAPSTISFHLRKLEEAGLAEKERTQYYLVYRLRASLLSLPLRDFVAAPVASGSPEMKRLAKARERVIRGHFRDGRLLHLPKRWKDRRIVLEEFLPLFEEGRDYPEKQVDERIRTKFPDHCTIRRLLVDERFLAREAGVYHRVAGQPAGLEIEPLSEAFPGKESQSVPNGASNRLSPREPVPEPTHRTRDGSRAGRPFGRAEQIRAYKEMPLEAGVYRIACAGNDKVFLGSAKNLRGPLNRHRFLLSTGNHPIREMQEDWVRFGPDAFEFEVVATVRPDDEPGSDVDRALEALEEEWIRKVDPFGPKGYNVDRNLRKLIVSSRPR